MSYLRVLFATACALALATCCLARPLDDYLNEATRLQQAGDLTQAIAVIEAAAGEYPNNPNVLAYMGSYRGMQAGAAQNIMEAGQLANESFALLDKAVDIDSLNVNARFYRGLMGVKVPAFLGRLDGALRDLEMVTVLNGDFPGMVPKQTLASTYDLLGEGYQKNGDAQKAEAAWRKVIELTPNSAAAQTAETKIAGLSAGSPPPPPRSAETPKPGETKDVAALLGQAQAAMDAANYNDAVKILKQVTGADSTNARAFRMLGVALAYSDRGYDKNIAEDTTLRTNLVFESMGYLDKAVKLAPDDLEARLARGTMAVNFPFFANRLDQGMTDLDMVVAGNAPEPMRAQAKYWLGFGYQKKGMSFWTQIVNENQDEATVSMVLDSMRPRAARFDRSKYAGPIVVVDFLLGFRDELPPQTAVWIEDARGSFLKTVYVSGFSGNAKGVQVVLPEYARISKFGDADAVTGASIDVGHYIYVWDLRDAGGKPVKPGTYTVKVETAYWPSMKYQLVAAAIAVGGGENRKVVQEGSYIPYLEVSYLP
jgi:tetratricopeptide (TPR) repeat protein